MSTTVQESMNDYRYPLEYVWSDAGQGRLRLSPRLKTNHNYWHQVHAATVLLHIELLPPFCDFVVYHVNTNVVHIERITSDAEWVVTNIRKFDDFYRGKIAPVVLAQVQYCEKITTVHFIFSLVGQCWTSFHKHKQSR